ncbi:MAG: hypothetical protein ACJ8BW_36845, partial [Ktedonobacteraceae bacterium]
ICSKYALRITCTSAESKAHSVGRLVVWWGILRATLPAHRTGTTTSTSYARCEASYRFARGVKEDIYRHGEQATVGSFP